MDMEDIDKRSKWNLSFPRVERVKRELNIEIPSDKIESYTPRTENVSKTFEKRYKERRRSFGVEKSRMGDDHSNSQVNSASTSRLIGRVFFLWASANILATIHAGIGASFAASLVIGIGLNMPILLGGLGMYIWHWLDRRKLRKQGIRYKDYIKPKIFRSRRR